MNNDLLGVLKLIILSALWGLMFGLSLQLFKYLNNL
jgi:hypothetical protein